MNVLNNIRMRIVIMSCLNYLFLLHLFNLILPLSGGCVIALKILEDFILWAKNTEITLKIYF